MDSKFHKEMKKMAGGSRKTEQMKLDKSTSDSAGDVKFSKTQQFLKIKTEKEQKPSSTLNQRSRDRLDIFERKFPPLRLETSLQGSTIRTATKPLDFHARLSTQQFSARSKNLPKIKLPRTKLGPAARLAGSNPRSVGSTLLSRRIECDDADYAKLLADLERMNEEMDRRLWRSRMNDNYRRLGRSVLSTPPTLPRHVSPRSSLMVTAEGLQNVPAVPSFTSTAKAVSEVEDYQQQDIHLNLKVLDQDKNAIQFKIKRHAPMKKLINTYCERKGLEIGSIRFLTPDGDRIHAEHTAAQLGLEDGDIIETVSPQSGGEG